MRKATLLKNATRSCRKARPLSVSRSIAEVRPRRRRTTWGVTAMSLVCALLRAGSRTSPPGYALAPRAQVDRVVGPAPDHGLGGEGGSVEQSAPGDLQRSKVRRLRQVGLALLRD